MEEKIVTILFVFFTIAGWVLYHKIFQVAYFDLGRGLLRELIGAIFFGAIMTAVCVYVFTGKGKLLNNDTSSEQESIGEDEEIEDYDDASDSNWLLGDYDDSNWLLGDYDDSNWFSEDDNASTDLYDDSSEYILPKSDRKKVKKSKLKKLSSYELRIARNEIMARHGRRFVDEELQAYFDSCSWYDGVIMPDDFEDSCLNKIERYNVDAIVKEENSRK